MKKELKNLSDPKKFHEPLIIEGIEKDILVKMIKSMIIIRKTEQKLAEARRDGLIGGPAHLGAGQEAIAVGTVTRSTMESMAAEEAAEIEGDEEMEGETSEETDEASTEDSE